MVQVPPDQAHHFAVSKLPQTCIQTAYVDDLLQGFRLWRTGGFKSRGFPKILKPVRVPGGKVIEKRAAFGGDIGHKQEYNQTTGMGRWFVAQMSLSEGEGFGQGECQVGVGFTAKKRGITVDHCKCVAEQIGLLDT